MLAAVKLSDVDLGQARTLGGAERRLALRLSTAVQRDRFLAGRIALRLHVARVAGVNPGSLYADYVCGRCSGKDRAHGAPRYRTGTDGLLVQGSLSRSGDWCLMAAVVDELVLGVGVDLECRASAGFEGFVAVAMTAGEREYVQRLPPSQRPLLQTVLWTRKEAILKALGRGLSLDPSLVDVAGVLPLLPGWTSGSGRWVVEDVNPGPLGLPNTGVAAMALLLDQ
ncbi:4'-phosphopantetheinyl transferase superfamily protein [Arthrobacter sp. ISL-65]|nr:4'-phosphopantetheinyl transferase superfamily protein [Arthrobacter sp. ISL-65]